jgi:nitric oxide reductase large subunit
VNVSVVYVPERGHDHQFAILGLSPFVTLFLFNQWSSTRLDEWLKDESVVVHCECTIGDWNAVGVRCSSH